MTSLGRLLAVATPLAVASMIGLTQLPDATLDGPVTVMAGGAIEQPVVEFPPAELPPSVWP